jgi:ELP3 family radical SAM enzyme/protein acetyltransferase
VLVKLREYGCTRVQLGVQHTDDAILLAVNRQATREDTVRAIKLLKDSCFKVDIHLMPDLPGATPDSDKRMFDDVLHSPDLQADQWKIYPCQTTPFTVIKRWYEEGRYQPYGMDHLIDVILYAKRQVHPWIRLNRVIRDIPVEYVLAGVEVANLRQLLEIRMKKEGQKCQCIRCREVKGDKDIAEKLKSSELVERSFDASGGKETFLSVETPDRQTIFGFLRLRFPPANAECPFQELWGCALIRELHVYGNLTSTKGEVRGDHAQHLGIGKKLLERAETLAESQGYSRIAVISGVGVREYYRRRGYTLIDPHRGAFMVKAIKGPAFHRVFAPIVADGAAMAASTASQLYEDIMRLQENFKENSETLFLLRTSRVARVRAACMVILVAFALWVVAAQ